ncbi:MAG: TetR/AcrR family transcriptional regulator [Candidatus Eisenbacteria bacterium]|nr:TetR/AcrR family transcriptional regulator [Candidatus Eisenbacteria bacterium]
MPQQPIDPGARERLLDAADHLLATRGFRHMTVAAVAARANVGKGSVYLHFASKDELALGCLDRMAERVSARLQAIAEGPGTPQARVRAMLAARVLERFDYARRHAPSIDQKLAVMRQSTSPPRPSAWRA